MPRPEPRGPRPALWRPGGHTAAFAWLLAAGRDRLALPEGLLPVAGAALWTALEFLRTYLFSGFPWALLGYTQYRQPTVRLLAAAIGVYGVSALVLFANGAAAGMLACLCRRRSESQRRRTLALHAVLVGLVAVGTITYARWMWRDVAGGPAIRIGVLQGNIDQSVKRTGDTRVVRWRPTSGWPAWRQRSGLADRLAETARCSSSGENRAGAARPGLRGTPGFRC
jgi:apolipoprotein N-acyltransferase